MTARQSARYFSRIAPVLGPGLAEKRVAWLGLEACAPVIELLAGCRLCRFCWIEPEEKGQELLNTLRRHNHFDDGWQVDPFSPEARPDLLLAGGNAQTMLKGLKLAQAWQIPALLYGPLAAESGREAIVIVCQPGSNLEAEQDLLEKLPETQGTLKAETITQVTAVAKAMLLSGTPYARPDYDRLFNQLNRNILLVGSADWPWQVKYAGAESWRPDFEKKISLATPPQNLAPHVAIFGCGGLGSLIAKELSREGVARFSLVDGGRVRIFHPARQFYHTSQLGQPKVYALAENLAGENFSAPETPLKRDEPKLYWGAKTVEAYNKKLSENCPAQIARLVDRIRPDLAVITTGTDLDFWLARALQRAKIPYLVARCYPRARYFEIIFSLPAEGTPCFDCLRGHLYTGPQPGLTEEELARYETGRAVALEAEPATLVETSRAAAVAARLGLEMLKPERSGWLQTLVAEGQNCLIGANETEQTAEGWAYGLSLPGQVAAFGLAQLFGNPSTRPCPTCGRTFQPIYRPDLQPNLKSG